MPMQLAVSAEKNNLRELELILDNVYESSFELDSYFRVTFLESNQNQNQSCSSVKASELKSIIWKAIKSFRSHYPDEELPYKEAKNQLDQQIGNNPYWKCESIIDKDNYDIVVQVYISSQQLSQVQIEFERIK